MTKQQIEKATGWYYEHKKHVDGIFFEGSGYYEPSKEDVDNPNLWKPASWRWFFTSRIINS